MHDRQAAALAAVAALEARAVKAHRALAELEAEQTGALGELAAVAGVELAAELTGVTTGKAREALTARRRQSTGDTAAADRAGGAR